MSTELNGPCRTPTGSGGFRSKTGTALTCPGDIGEPPRAAASVLIVWDVQTDAGTNELDSPALLRLIFLTVVPQHGRIDIFPTWSGNIDDYRLIIAKGGFGSRMPDFIAANVPNTWRGRIHMTAEHSGFPGTIASVNRFASRSGITVVSDALPGNRVSVPSDGTNEGGALMFGQTTLWFSAASSVSGGFPLSLNVPGGSPWISHRRGVNDRIDWVISGDSNHIWEEESSRFIGTGAVAHNSPFFQNLYTVPLP